MNTFLAIITFILQVISCSYFAIAVGDNFGKATNKNFSHSLTVIIYFVINLLHFYILPQFEFKGIISTIGIFAVLFLVHKLDFWQSIGLSITFITIQFISELLCVNIFIVATNLTIQDMLEKSWLIQILSSTVAVITLLLTFLLTKLVIKRITNMNILSKLNKKFIMLIIICIMILLLPQLLLITLNNYNFDIYFLITMFIQFLVFNIIIVLFFYFRFKKQLLENDLKIKEIDLQNLIQVIDGVRVLKHDMNNIFQAINGYMVNKKYSELEDYLSTVTKECQIINNFAVTSQQVFNEPAIYGIIGSKQFLANENDIMMEIDSTVDYTTINFPMASLSRILGILIDNAMEACLKSEEKYIRIEVKHNHLKEATIFKIYNTFANDLVIDLNKIYDKGYSTKKVKSGLGLWEVKKLIKRHKNSQIFASIESNKFVQTIIIEDSI